MVRLFSWISLILMSAALAACGSSSSSTPAAAPVPVPTAPQNPQTITINIPAGAMNMGANAFGQNPLTIQAGTQVTWMNNDSIAHTSTSDTGVWDSGLIQPGQTFSRVFNDAGTFSYHCSVHPTMTGTIQVGAAQPSPTPTATQMPGGGY